MNFNNIQPSKTVDRHNARMNFCSVRIRRATTGLSLRQTLFPRTSTFTYSLFNPISCESPNDKLALLICSFKEILKSFFYNSLNIVFSQHNICTYRNLFALVLSAVVQRFICILLDLQIYLYFLF